MATEACVGQRLEVCLLRDEAGGERHTGHRRRGDRRRRLDPPPPSPERGQVTDIAVPVSRSRMPTTMNSAALNSAWTTRSSQPASAASGVPAPKSTIMNPS